jgi:hypothetical protein
VWGKLALGVLVLLIVPIAAAAFAFGCFMVTGLFTGMVFGVLDALGIAHWNNTTFLAVTIPLAVVFGIARVVFGDQLRNI